MKIAFISDVHGNYIALQTVLSRIKNLSVDEIIFLGDLCTLGPKPKEVAELLLSNCGKNVLGNHDEYLYNEESLQNYTDHQIILDSVHFASSQIPIEILNSIKLFSSTLKLDSEVGSILCYHGSPRSNSENIFSETSIEDLDYMFNYNNFFLFVGGHTHIQMHKRFHSMTILNAGSVGQPFKSKSISGIPELLPHTEFLLVTIKNRGVQFEMIQMAYDLELHVKQILESQLPLKWWLKEQFKL